MSQTDIWSAYTAPREGTTLQSALGLAMLGPAGVFGLVLLCWSFAKGKKIYLFFGLVFWFRKSRRKQPSTTGISFVLVLCKGEKVCFHSAAQLQNLPTLPFPARKNNKLFKSNSHNPTTGALNFKIFKRLITINDSLAKHHAMTKATKSSDVKACGSQWQPAEVMPSKGKKTL